MRDAPLQGLAVGFFDGVHLGHRAILKGADAALTFRNHPLSVLAPGIAPRLIMTCEERIAAIRACGVKDVTVLDFTPELAGMPAEDFVRRHLAVSGSRLPLSVRCGENWRFGRGGVGNADFLRRLGFAVQVVPYAEYRGERISSSRVRAALESGEIEEANAMMGRSFRISGVRFPGKGVGREIGYPTVNLGIPAFGSDEGGGTRRIDLRRGVYEVEVDGVRAIANYGCAPTMGEKAWKTPILEIHFLSDPPGSCSEVVVGFLRFIRPERTFASVRDLQRQIAADCATIRT